MQKNNHATQILEPKDDTILMELSQNLMCIYHKLIQHAKNQNYNLEDVHQALIEKHGLDIPLRNSTQNSTDVVFHENLTNWKKIFDDELSIDNKLTLDNIKNILISFISSAKPPIELQGDISTLPLPLKQSQLHIYLNNPIFKEQLDALAENNISAFELLSKILGNNNFEIGIEQNYFYGFNLSETQNLFEQEEF